MLEVTDLTRSFGGMKVLEDMTFSLAGGDRTALQGPNGSGKSTLLRCIAGALSPDRGSITVAGEVAGSRKARRLIGVSLAQERAFYLRLSGRENLLTFARLRHARDRDAIQEVDEIIHELAIEQICRERADRCSSGMLQQLSFARSLLGAPRLLLLDEPTRSLDEDAREAFWRALDRRHHTTVLLSTHTEDDATRCSRRLLLVSRAR